MKVCTYVHTYTYGTYTYRIDSFAAKAYSTDTVVLVSRAKLVAGSLYLAPLWPWVDLLPQSRHLGCAVSPSILEREQVTQSSTAARSVALRQLTVVPHFMH